MEDPRSNPAGISPLKHAKLNDVLLRKPEKPLYHYTTQAGLLGIMKQREIWATHTQYLNDRREFLHAADLVRAEIIRLLTELTENHTHTGARVDALKNMLDAVNESHEHINVCVCSFSEASDSLPQWRAYGGSSGFAIRFSPEFLRVAVERQGFVLAKCIYDPADQLDIVRALVEEVLDEHLSKQPVLDEQEAEIDEMFWNMGGNLLDYLYRYAPMLKDRAFKEEEEWRIISKPIDAPSLDFREGRSLIVPYYRLPLWKERQTEIHEIVVGPTRDIERSIQSVNRLIKSRTIGRRRFVPIKPSEVPYRDW